MTTEPGSIYHVAWREVCPWLLLFRTFRLALRLPLLVLGTLAAVLIPIGWRGAELVFLPSDSVAVEADLQDWVAYRGAWPSAQFRQLNDAPRFASAADVVEAAVRNGPCLLLYREGIEPFVRMFRATRFDLATWAYWGAGSIWTLLVWGWLGGALNRMALVRLGCDQAVGLRESLRFSRRRLRSYVLAPLLPLSGVALACLASAVAGLLMRADWGVVVAGVGWFSVLILGFVIVVLTAGTGLGWPLMWGAIGAEPDGDEFEAFHRSFSFALGRPLNYLAYFLLVAAIGTAGTVVVDAIARSTIAAARWSAAWGAGTERSQQLEILADDRTDAQDGSAGERPAGESTPSEQHAAAIGLRIIDGWEEFVRTLAMGFRHSFFWCAAAGMYLLLRRDVDETELDDLFLEDLEPQPGLPPLNQAGPGSPA